MPNTRAMRFAIHRLLGSEWSILIFLLACLTSCAPKFVYPTDPYEVNHHTYLYYAPSIETNIDHALDVETFHATNSEEDEELRLATEKIVELAKDQHVPSMSLLGRFLLAHAVSYELAGGWRGKFGRHYRKDAKRQGLSRRKYEERYENAQEIGIKYLLIAAQYGYQPSISVLKSLKVEVPPRQLDPPKVKKAWENYTVAKAKHSQRMKSLVSAIGAGIAAAGNAYSSRTASSPTYTQPQLKDFTGCSSDFDCGVGRRCVKGFGKLTGACVQAVDEYGLPSLELPDVDSMGFQEGQCSFTTDCPIGFSCDKSLGGLKGFCVK